MLYVSHIEHGDVMTAQQIANTLVNGRTYMVRTSRSDTKGPWTAEDLFVQTYKGQVVTITLRNRDWAEYDPRDCDLVLDGDKLCMAVEDYWMDIQIQTITHASEG